MQPDQAATDLLQQAYQGFNARAADAVLALMQPDVEWPKGFVGGYEHGRDAVRAYWADQWASIDPHVAPTGFELLPDGRVAVTVHQVVRELDGTLLMDTTLRHVYRLRDGLIAHMEIQPLSGTEATQARRLAEKYVDAYNRFDVPGMLACLQPDVQFEHATNGVVTVRLEGKEAFESQAMRAAAWFAERTQRITAWRWQDGQAEADIDYFALTATDLPNGVPAGTTLNFAGRSRFTFRDGLIAFIQDFS